MPLDAETFKARVVEAMVASATWVVDGNYSVVRETVWERADTVVWFDLPYAVVMARTIKRTVRRVVTREELWNGNREPWSNLYSFDPKKSIIAWAATRNGRRIRLRYTGTAKNDAWLHTRCAAVNLRTLLRHGVTRSEGAWTLA